jgi:DNA polymerase III subunit chi
VTEIGFYHLTRTGLEQALGRLLGRALASGQRAVVLCADSQRLAALDQALWQCSEPDWLPHGTASDGDAALQPIWLTADDVAPNDARLLFLIDGVQSARIAEFDRVFDLFDGKDEAAVAAARERWTAAKAEGHSLTYWQQGARGWERRA